MDTSFNCPKCSLHITADDCVVGEEIDCPECGEEFRVPPPAKPKPKPVPVVVKSAAPAPAPTAHAVPAQTAGSTTTTAPAPAPPTTAEAPKPEAKPSAPAHEHKPLVVPHHSGPAESLVKKVAHLEPKHEAPKLRVKTIKRGACVEVGHDLFDEKVTDFLNKIGQENIINISPISYGAMDSTGHMLPDYGIMVVYRG